MRRLKDWYLTLFAKLFDCKLCFIFKISYMFSEIPIFVWHLRSFVCLFWHRSDSITGLLALKPCEQSNLHDKAVNVLKTGSFKWTLLDHSFSFLNVLNLFGYLNFKAISCSLTSSCLFTPYQLPALPHWSKPCSRMWSCGCSDKIRLLGTDDMRAEAAWSSWPTVVDVNWVIVNL